MRVCKFQNGVPWRPVLGLALLLSLSAVLLFAAVLRTPVVKISQDSFDKISIGMTEAEVLAIIGAPPGDYYMRPTGFLYSIEFVKEGIQKEWHGEEGFLYVWVDENGKVCDKWFDPRWWPREP